MNVLALAGDFAAAVPLSRMLQKQAPGPFVPIVMSSAYFKAKRYGDALAAGDEALKFGPRYADAHKVRGDALRMLGRIDEALDEYAAAEKTAPRWGRLQIDWAIAAWRKGDRAGARDHLRKAAAMDLGTRDRAVLGRLQQLMGA